MLSALPTNTDVLVVGCGNAALVSAITAAQNSNVRVNVIESAPKEMLGGNSRFTLGGFRFGFHNPKQVYQLLNDLTEQEFKMIRQFSYTRVDFFSDLQRLSNSLADPLLSQFLANNSYHVIKWLHSIGVKWSLYISDIIPEPLWQASPGNLYVSGRGKGLIQHLLLRAKEAAIKVTNNCQLEKILPHNGKAGLGVVVKHNGEYHKIFCKSIILACGGFEASADMRSKYLGEAWGRMRVRGTKYNTGKGLKAALEIGAQKYGQWENGHAVPIAADAPEFGSLTLGETTRRCLFQYGISVNRAGKRFMDEGENKKTFMYSKTGLAVASQKDGTVYQIFDAHILSANFEKDFYFSGQFLVANSLKELADLLEVPQEDFLAEIREYNSAIDESNTFNPAILDGRCTVGVNPKRSNYATQFKTPPFFAFKVVGGITFTYGGLKINPKCQVLDKFDQPIRGIFAAGEITGGFFANTYPANSGLTRGAVTGYFAGKGAANYSKNL